MTTPEGEAPAGEAVDVIDETVEVADAAVEVVEEDLDPATALKKELRGKPGDWYVIHSYAGYENKVKANLETRVQNLDVGDYIFQVEVPTEEVTEIKNGQRKQVNRKVLPGYILVRMDLTDDSWSAVRNTPGVTGFVGATSRPTSLSLDDVVKFLDAAVASGRVPSRAALVTSAVEREMRRQAADQDAALLRQRAASAHQSLQEYLRSQLIRQAAKPTVDDVLARASERDGGRLILADAAATIAADRAGR